MLNIMSSLLHTIVEELKSKERAIETTNEMPVHGVWRESYWVGGAQYTALQGEARIQTRAATKWIEDYPALAPEFARAYLKIKYKGAKLRCNRMQYHQAVKERPPSPLYARPNIEKEHLVYIDLRSAYWQILCALGWDVDYMRGAFVGVRSSNSDFPLPSWKLARNALVTVSLPSAATMWSKGRIMQVRVGQPNTNYIVWQVCQDVLHGIACDAVAAGAIYVHTDGYIARGYDADRVREAIAQWGMTTAIKTYGEGWVRGVGAYIMAGSKSGAYDRVQMRSFNNLYNPNVDFLRPRFAHFRMAVDPFPHD